MIAFFVTVYFWGLMTVSSVLFIPVAALLRVVTAPFDRRLALLHQFSCFWASLYTWLNPWWSVTIQGREHLERSRATVMVANHQSFVDILVLYRLFTHFKWVSKAENFRVPFVGWNMSLNRYIRINRKSIRSAMQMMRDCEQALREGSPVMMFPEGTRSPDGTLGSFKPGAFELALKARVPVQPIVINGSARALPKRGWLLRGTHHIHVHVLPVVSVDSYAGNAAPALSRSVRSVIEAELKEMRKH